MARTDPAVRAYLRRMGKRGGKARAKSLTKEERSEIARRGAAVTNLKRWGTAPKKKVPKRQKKSVDRQAKEADTMGVGHSEAR